MFGYRWGRGLILGSAALAFVLAGCGEGEGGSRFLSIGTAGTGGIYYVLGGAMANRLSASDSLRRYTAEVTAGAVENVNRVSSGDMDIAIVTGNTIYEAYRDSVERPQYGTLRVVAPLYPNVVHLLVSGRSEITSVAELRGARISVGAPGSGTEQTARDVLAAHDLDYSDLDEQFLSFTESASALRDGAIDAAIFSVGYPASAVLEATTGTNVRLLAIDPEGIQRLVDRYPYYEAGAIPAGSYPRVDEDLQTVVALNWIVAREDLADDVVTRILDLLRDEQDGLAQVHDIVRQIDLAALRGSTPVPLHPAAAQWIE